MVRVICKPLKTVLLYKVYIFFNMPKCFFVVLKIKIMGKNYGKSQCPLKLHVSKVQMKNILKYHANCIQCKQNVFVWHILLKGCYLSFHVIIRTLLRWRCSVIKLRWDLQGTSSFANHYGNAKIVLILVLEFKVNIFNMCRY